MTDITDMDLSALRDEVARLRSEFTGLRDKFARKLAGGAHTVADAIDSELTEGQISARLAALEKHVESAANRVKDSGKEAVHRLESEVTDRPLTAIAVAFGVGLLAAQFLRR